jgi:ubiquinol-cytochrome c reductase cytochrome b subunit
VVAVPIVLLALVVLHLLALHEVGSNNPDGVEIKKNKDAGWRSAGRRCVPPVLHGARPAGVVRIPVRFLCHHVLHAGNGRFFLEYANFEEANSLKTPDHIAPVWYSRRSIRCCVRCPTSSGASWPSAAAMAILFVLPWLDRSPVKSSVTSGMLSRACWS